MFSCSLLFPHQLLVIRLVSAGANLAKQPLPVCLFINLSWRGPTFIKPSGSCLFHQPPPTPVSSVRDSCADWTSPRTAHSSTRRLSPAIYIAIIHQAICVCVCGAVTSHYRDAPLAPMWTHEQHKRHDVMYISEGRYGSEPRFIYFLTIKLEESVMRRWQTYSLDVHSISSYRNYILPSPVVHGEMVIILLVSQPIWTQRKSDILW